MKDLIKHRSNLINGTGADNNKVIATTIYGTDFSIFTPPRRLSRGTRRPQELLERSTDGTRSWRVTRNIFTCLRPTQLCPTGRGVGLKCFLALKGEIRITQRGRSGKHHPTRTHVKEREEKRDEVEESDKWLWQRISESYFFCYLNQRYYFPNNSSLLSRATFKDKRREANERKCKVQRKATSVGR